MEKNGGAGQREANIAGEMTKVALETNPMAVDHHHSQLMELGHHGDATRIAYPASTNAAIFGRAPCHQLRAIYLHPPQSIKHTPDGGWVDEPTPETLKAR